MDVAGLATLPIVMPEGAGAAVLREDGTQGKGNAFFTMLPPSAEVMTTTEQQPVSVLSGSLQGLGKAGLAWVAGDQPVPGSAGLSENLLGSSFKPAPKDVPGALASSAPDFAGALGTSRPFPAPDVETVAGAASLPGLPEGRAVAAAPQTILSRSVDSTHDRAPAEEMLNAARDLKSSTVVQKPEGEQVPIAAGVAAVSALLRSDRSSPSGTVGIGAELLSEPEQPPPPPATADALHQIAQLVQKPSLRTEPPARKGDENARAHPQQEDPDSGSDAGAPSNAGRPVAAGGTTEADNAVIPVALAEAARYAAPKIESTKRDPATAGVPDAVSEALAVQSPGAEAMSLASRSARPAAVSVTAAKDGTSSAAALPVESESDRPGRQKPEAEAIAAAGSQTAGRTPRITEQTFTTAVQPLSRDKTSSAGSPDTVALAGEPAGVGSETGEATSALASFPVPEAEAAPAMPPEPAAGEMQPNAPAKFPPLLGSDPEGPTKTPALQVQTTATVESDQGKTASAARSENARMRAGGVDADAATEKSGNAARTLEGGARSSQKVPAQSMQAFEPARLEEGDKASTARSEIGSSGASGGGADADAEKPADVVTTGDVLDAGSSLTTDANSRNNATVQHVPVAASHVVAPPVTPSGEDLGMANAKHITVGPARPGHGRKESAQNSPDLTTGPGDDPASETGASAASAKVERADGGAPQAAPVDALAKPDLGLVDVALHSQDTNQSRTALGAPAETVKPADRQNRTEDATFRPTDRAPSGQPGQYTGPVLQAQRPLGRPLAIAIGKTVQDGREQLRISLDPKDLGQLDVRLNIERNGTLRAVVTASSEASVELLRQDMPSLVRSLADAGLKVDGGSIRFEVQADAGGQSQHRQNRDQQQSGAGPAAAENQFVEEELYAMRPLRAGSMIELRA